MEIKVIIFLVNAWHGGPYLGIAGAKVRSCIQNGFVVRTYFSRFMELFPSYQPCLPSGPSPVWRWRDLGLSARKVCVKTIIVHHLIFSATWQVTKVPGSGNWNCWSSSSGAPPLCSAWLLSWAVTNTPTRDISSLPQSTILARSQHTFSSTVPCSALPGLVRVSWSSTATSRYWRQTGEMWGRTSSL